MVPFLIKAKTEFSSFKQTLPREWHRDLKFARNRGRELQPPDCSGAAQKDQLAWVRSELGLGEKKKRKQKKTKIKIWLR